MHSQKVDLVTRSTPPVMVVRIEPADYMRALTNALQNAWPGPIDVVYATRALTQPWDADDNEFHVLPHGLFASVRALSIRMKATRPCLLHVAGWSAPTSLAAILHGNAQNVPVIVDLDTWRGSPSLWRRTLKQALYPRLFERVTHFAPGGRRQAAYLRQFGVPDSKITPVGMTTDILAIRAALAQEPSAGSEFRRRFGISQEALVALFMGRLVALKGLRELLEAWSEISSQYPQCRLVIAGDGPLRDHIAAEAAQNPSIIPTGRLNGLDVWRAYAAADFLVAPSHSEAWGLTVNEAMAAGTPIIITDIFGCAGDLLHDGQTGLIVQPHNRSQLTHAMRRLIEDPNLRAGLAQAASNQISNWTIEAEANNIIGIWNRTLNSTRSNGNVA